MLTLMVLVRDLADLYQDQWAALGQTSAPALFAAAPKAACVMVMTEYEIEASSIQSMTAALERAHEQISRDNVFGPERVQIQKAWDARNANNIEAANAFMRQAAAATASAIDTWEKNRS